LPDPCPYVLTSSAGVVEVWSSYQIQFGGMRRFLWQSDLVGELKLALASMQMDPDEALSGVYCASEPSRCDVENRLFTNPGTSTFSPGTTSIRWERGREMPRPPAGLAEAACVHYYRYQPAKHFQLWQRDQVLVRWSEAVRPLAHDGSARPMWCALREAVLAGKVEQLGPPLLESQRYGLRIEVRAPRNGPRSAPAVSEALVDGALSALHTGASAEDVASVAEALGPKFPHLERGRILELLAVRPMPLTGSPFKVSAAGVQFSPADEFCDAGEVTIFRDPRCKVVETSGELFTLAPTSTSAGLGLS
jgi:hypothetical protein